METREYGEIPFGIAGSFISTISCGIPLPFGLPAKLGTVIRTGRLDSIPIIFAQRDSGRCLARDVATLAKTRFALLPRRNEAPPPGQIPTHPCRGWILAGDGFQSHG